MSTAQLAYPEALRALGRIPDRDEANRDEAKAAPVSRRSVFATLKEWFQGYDDYFAELEQTRPASVRQERRERRNEDRLIVMALMGR